LASTITTIGPGSVLREATRRNGKKAVRTCVSLERTWLAHSEPGMVSQGTRGVVVVSSRRFSGRWEGKSRCVRNEEFDEVAFASRWKGNSVFCESRTTSEDVESSFDI